jgi:hypothetical protein
MKNIIFNNYGQFLKDSGYNNVTTFHKHVMDTYLSKPFLVLVFLTLSSLASGVLFDSFFVMSFIPLLILTQISFSVIKFFKSRDELILTDGSLFIRSGVFFVDIIEYNFSTIETIEIKHSLLSSYFNYGDVVIRGNGGTERTISRVEWALSVRLAFQNHKNPPVIDSNPINSNKRQNPIVSPILLKGCEKLLENKN